MDKMRRGFEQAPQYHQAPSNENEHEVLPPILLPEYADALIDVVNKLDPFEFAKISKTCRYLYDFCWNAKGIKIPLNCVVEVDRFKTHVWTGDKNHFYDNQRNRKDLTDAQIEELVQKKPKQFQIRVELVYLRPGFGENNGIGRRFAEAREFLGRIGCEVTERICIWAPEYGFRVPSDDLIHFVEELGAKEFRSNACIQEVAVTHLCRNMVSLHLHLPLIFNFNFEAKMPPRLHFGRHFSFDELTVVLKAWTRGHFDIEKWSLGSNFHPWDDTINFFDDFINHFPSYCILGPFFRFPLPSARPLLLIEQNKNKLPRYLLRNDGQILGMFFRQNNPDDISGVYLRQLQPTYLHRKIPMLFPTIEKETDYF